MPTCQVCRQENPAGARYCNACGAPLGGEARPLRQERKVVTVLFADLVGFTARAERMDPEEVQRLLEPYHAHLRSVLERHGGTVAKFVGDAVMAIFGAPAVHEDDPERAVRAALAIREELAAGGDLEVHIGITTGEALITLDARIDKGEHTASGDSVNTAARLTSTTPEGRAPCTPGCSPLGTSTPRCHPSSAEDRCREASGSWPRRWPGGQRPLSTSRPRSG